MRAGDDSAAWWPGTDEQLHSNLAVMLQELGLPSYDALYRWSVDEPEQFWGYMLDRLRIRFQRAPRQMLAAAEDPVRARWLPDALLNIAESCFLAPPDRPALLHDSEDGQQTQWSYGDLERMSRRVAHGLQRLGVGAGSPVGLVMAMTPEAVAAWLGVVLTGAVVVSLPDSLAASEMAARLALVPCALVLTQDVVLRGLLVLVAAVRATAPDGRAVARDDCKRRAGPKRVRCVQRRRLGMMSGCSAPHSH